MRFLISLILVVFLSACAGVKTPEKGPLTLKPASFSDLEGWRGDDHAAALAAFRKSCTRILKQDPGKAFGPVGGTYGDWQPACREAASVDPARAKDFFERHFRPWQALAGQDPEGLFTGYYEASLRGSRTPYGPYQTPLLARPADLVMVDLGEFRDELKGQRIAGRVVGAYLKPYEDRAAIEAGALKNAQALAWVDDPVDAFFLHIQGSGIVELAEGGELRVGFDGQNGHPYYAIGRELVKRGELPKEDVSLQSIRAWLAAHPGQARSLMDTNRSYIFFKELAEGEGPQGGEGVALTPLRSLAVDRTQIPYGAPLWLEAAAPTPTADPIQRLMIAQDTGGAIVGAVRGDVFWGHGPQAEAMAGPMKSKGRYWLLLPAGASPR